MNLMNEEKWSIMNGAFQDILKDNAGGETNFAKMLFPCLKFVMKGLPAQRQIEQNCVKRQWKD